MKWQALRKRLKEYRSSLKKKGARVLVGGHSEAPPKQTQHTITNNTTRSSSNKEEECKLKPAATLKPNDRKSQLHEDAISNIIDCLEVGVNEQVESKEASLAR